MSKYTVEVMFDCMIKGNYIRCGWTLLGSYFDFEYAIQGWLEHVMFVNRSLVRLVKDGHEILRFTGKWYIIE